MDLSQIYTEVIMEHSRSGHNKHPLEIATESVRGHNPSCGDDITLFLNIENEVIKEASFEGVGCAISQASASMMIDLIKGSSVLDAKRKLETFLGMIKNEVSNEIAEDVLEDAFLLSNIKNMPARVKCAVLAWHSLEEALLK